MRDLCQTWQKTGRVDQAATQAMSFDEVKKLLGVDRFLNVRGSLSDGGKFMKEL
jgi:hypothetical protein